MDKARFIDMTSRSRLESECHELRIQLKGWEKTFAEAHSGRKPSKEDIKKNLEIATKYKAYNRTRDVLDGRKDASTLHFPSPSMLKLNPASSLQPAGPDDDQKLQKTQPYATPRKTRASIAEAHPSILDPYDAPSDSVSPHPYVFKNAIGPTPQRDGNLLGLFDLLSRSGSTPSTRKRKAEVLDVDSAGRKAAQTPSKRPARENGDLLQFLEPDTGRRRRHSRTPASDGKRFLLSQFFATPSTMRFAALVGDDQDETTPKDVVIDHTPLRTRVLGGQTQGRLQDEKALETTPAFLKRTASFHQRLLTASNPDARTHASPTAARTGPSFRPLKGKPLSEILRSLRQMEDNDDEDEMDALREIEGNEANVLIGNSQDVGETATAQASPPWIRKKKGQKRTTRRVIMRPVTTKREQNKAEIMPESEEYDDDASMNKQKTAKTRETQAPNIDTPPLAGDVDALNKPLSVRDEIDGQDKENDTDSTSSEYDDLASPTQPKTNAPNSTIGHTASSTKADEKSSRHPAQARSKRGAHAANQEKNREKDKGKTQGKGINPNALSHMNFRSLKIRNRNSKGRGKGRFGRGRR